MNIISGKEYLTRYAASLKETNAKAGLQPCLAIIVVGDDKENLIYIGLKENAVAAMGGKTRIVSLPVHTDKEEILQADCCP